MAVLEGGGSKGPEQLMAQEHIRGWMLAQSSATHVCSGHLGTASTVLLPATAATRRPSLAPPCMLLLARSLGAPPPPPLLPCCARESCGPRMRRESGGTVERLGDRTQLCLEGGIWGLFLETTD